MTTCGHRNRVPSVCRGWSALLCLSCCCQIQLAHLRAAILAPLAVLPKRQKQGVGSQLVKRGLEQLQKDGLELAAQRQEMRYLCFCLQVVCVFFLWWAVAWWCHVFCVVLHCCLFVCCLSVCLPACLSVCRPVCLPACLSACLPACLPVCLSVCLSVCLIVFFYLFCLLACLPF